MICRRDTLGFIDFMRGKYSVSNKEYILNMMKQMTHSEKNRLRTVSFDQIWRELWGETPENEQYRTEEHTSREKIAMLRNGVVSKDDYYTLETLLDESTIHTAMWGSTDGLGEPWQVAEWGFPKGRRNYQEKDYECAIREFCEETGYPSSTLVPIKNLLPFEEIFTGSNYKSYKHKYYLTYMPYEASLMKCMVQSSEVSRAEWKTFDECMRDIRHYNVEKKRMLTNIDHTIREYL
jgi:ADP-ribose pyrophosphatase YjhB (NUDIX family)